MNFQKAMAERCPNLVKDINFYSQGQQTPDRINIFLKITPGHTIVNTLKKELLKEAREKQLIIYRRTMIQMTVVFSSKTIKAKNIAEVKNIQTGILYPVKIFFENHSEIKTFLDKRNSY